MLSLVEDGNSLIINPRTIFFSMTFFYSRFNKLTDRFFKTNPWPDAEVVAPIVQNGKDLDKSSFVCVCGGGGGVTKIFNF